MQQLKYIYDVSQLYKTLRKAYKNQKEVEDLVSRIDLCLMFDIA